MAHVSHKLRNAFEGALAGGGDPATSPLYVFGPFLKLIIVTGAVGLVADVTFGASVWLVVITVAVVSAMYRLVMRWITDGSGGSGLSEEEFGGWAAKINAAITFIEYTLTFLVSMAAMVTFIADRAPALNGFIFWHVQYRTLVAIALSVLTGWLVNRGPKMAARAFGPATFGVLLLLWAMIISTLLKFGLNFPDFNFQAFSLEIAAEGKTFLHYTLGGYVRILAVMTGIEVFANMVAAFDGSAAEKSKKAFNSLLIIMGTTAITMLIVGPAIMEIAKPNLLAEAAHTASEIGAEEVSVFTRTMDVLLPEPLPYIGTLVGIAVLMSASAAAAQGLQNLALGLSERRYVPPSLGQRNQFQVADKPVWIQVAIVAICFILFGTNEETYLAIYAAGVFVLLSMTGWAVAKRLINQIREKFNVGTLALIAGTIVAAILTTGATGIIFVERFAEGAWTYLVFIPLLYIMFSYSRARLGAPTGSMDYLGRLNAAQLAGFGFGQMAPASSTSITKVSKPEDLRWEPAPKQQSKWREEQVTIKNIAVLLDSSSNAEGALPWAKTISKYANAQLTLLSSIKNHTTALQEQFEATKAERQTYLEKVVQDAQAENIPTDYAIRPGFIADAAQSLGHEQNLDLIITTTRGKSGEKHWLSGGVSRKLIQKVNQPILLIQVDEEGQAPPPKFDRILVALDGSIYSERVLPYARAMAQTFNSELILLSVPAVPEPANYHAPAEIVETIRDNAEANMRHFLDAVARSLRDENVEARTIVTGSLPARTIVQVADNENVDLIMSTSRGRGGVDLFMMGSEAQRVVEKTTKPVFMMPIHDRPN
ncbi:MAG: universal stress protein [Anaerolineales bacterium]|nr:universal stress protein [Anaerolineales bacterium]